MKIKITKTLLICAMLLFGASRGFSQTNLALASTPSHSGGGAGTYGPGMYTDGNKTTPGSFGWVSTSGNPCTNGCWIQFDWSSAQTMNRLTYYPDELTNRTMVGGTIESWNGSSWSFVKTFSVSPGSPTVIDFNTVSTTKLRIVSITTQGSQNTNPSTREIEIYNTYTYLNDAGTTVFTPLAICPNPQDISVRVANFGKRRLDSFRVNWSVNGVTQTPKYVTSKLAAGKDTFMPVKPNFALTNNTTYNFRVWTSHPNGLTDSSKGNDTIKYTLKFIGFPSPPTTTDIIQCGRGSATLKATPASPGDSIAWFDAPTGGTFLGLGKTIKSPFITQTTTFYAQVGGGSRTKIDNGFTGGTIVSGGTVNGAYWNIIPTKTIFLDSIMLRLYQFVTNPAYDLYYRVGTYQGNETNSAAWTLITKERGRNVVVAGQNRSIFNAGNVQLSAGVTYGFHYMTNAIAGHDFYLTNGMNTKSNADVKFEGGSVTNNYWGSSGVYTTWTLDQELTYGSAPLNPCASSSPRIPLKVTVNPTPSGATTIKSTPFQTSQPSTFGILADPDIVAESDQLTYELTAPTLYPNTSYNSTWNISSFTVRTGSGTPVNTSLYNLTVPSGSTNAKFWFKPDATLIDTNILITISVRDKGPYFCDSFIYRHIRVVPRPVPDFKFNTPICEGEAVFFDNFSTIQSGNMTYKWDFGTGNAADTSIAFTPVFKFPGSGTYQVKLTATSSPYGYIVTKTIPVTVNEIPKVNFTRTNACEGQDVILKNTTTITVPSTITYKWALGDGNFRTTTDVTYKYATPGGYVVTLTATANGCSNSISKNVYTFAKPKAAYTAPAGLLCGRRDLTFTNNSTISSGLAGSYWNFADGNLSTDESPVHNYATDGSYAVKLLMVSEFGCKDSVTKTIIVKETPLVGYTNSQPCDLTPTTFTNTTTHGSLNVPVYKWNFGDGTTSFQTSPVHSWTTLGPKNIKLVATAPNGCIDSIEKQFTVLPQPSVKFNVSDLCSGEGLEIENNTNVNQGDLTYDWSFGDGRKSSDRVPALSYNVTSTTTFNITLKSTVVGGCSDSLTKSVTVSENPNCAFTATRDWTNGARGMKFTAANTSYASYYYTFGDGGNAAIASPTYKYLYDGVFTVKMTAVNSVGCDCELTKEIAVNSNTGIADLGNKSLVKVFPNPTTGKLNVNINGKAKVVKIEVFNLLGEKVMTKTGISSVQQYELNLEKIASGMYIVKVSTDKGDSINKITLTR